MNIDELQTNYLIMEHSAALWRDAGGARELGDLVLGCRRGGEVRRTRLLDSSV